MCAELLNTSRFIITPEGIIYQTVSERRVTNADQVLLAAFDKKGLVLANLVRDTHLHVKGENTYVAKRLKKITLNMIFSLSMNSEQKPVLLPTFKDAPVGSFRGSADWTPPDDMQLYMITHQMGGNVPLVYLVAFCKTDALKGQFILPLPNTFDTAQICMGSAWDSGELISGCGNAPLEVIDKAIECFNSSPSNADLSDNKLGRCRSMFQFDGDRKQLPVPSNWASLCSRAGGSAYDWIFNIL